MRKRIPWLLAVLLVAGTLAGGAYGAARHIGGEAGSAPDVVTFAVAASAVSSLPVVEATPTAQPPPTIEATPEPVEEAAAAPEDGDAEPSAVAPDVHSASSEPAPQPPPPQPPPVDPATLEAAVVAGINAQRAAAGLPPLLLEPDLVMVARERSSDMAQRSYFSHVSPTGETFSSLMQSRGVACSWCGENIAYNNFGDDQTVAVVLSAWMASPGHRDSILRSSFNRVGVGVALGGSGVKYYTAVFAGP
jgi:uncharacterized protein YkwD